MGNYLQNQQKANRAEQQRNRARIIAIGIILATIPFYCVGGIAYFLAPNAPQIAPTSTLAPTQTATQGGSLPVSQTPIQQQPSATFTLIPTVLPSATGALGVPPTVPPLFTNTPTQTPTQAATQTPQPSPTPAATSTPQPSPTPAATSTPLPFSDG